MSKLSNLEQKIGAQYKRHDVADVVRAIARQVDGLTEGGISYKDNAVSVAPTSSAVANAVGDWRWKLNPTVQGTAGAQYVTFAFQCVASGSPGAWVELRGLTGT